MRVQCLIKSEGDSVVVTTRSITLGVSLIGMGVASSVITRTVDSVLDLPVVLSAEEVEFVYLAGCVKLIDLGWISKELREKNNITTEELCNILNR